MLKIDFGVTTACLLYHCCIIFVVSLFRLNDIYGPSLQKGRTKEHWI